MIFELELPDDLWRKLGPAPQARLRALVERFGDYNATDSIIVLTPEQVREIQELSGESVATLTTGGSIVGLFKRITGITIQGVRWQFPPGVLERTAEQAQFYGKDHKTYLKELVEDVMRRATDQW